MVRKCKMSKYRTITMPTCPYCKKYTPSMAVGNSDYGKLVNMATGYGSSDVVLRCGYCKEEFRVTCNIRFYGKKLK
jgi:hypothetical protein